MAADRYLSGVRAVVLEQGLGKGRTRILRKQLEAKGGSVLSGVESGAATHLLVGNNVRRSRLPVLLRVEEVPPGTRVVRADWLSSCLARGEYVSEVQYDLPLDATTPSTTPITSPQKEGGEEGEGGGVGQVVKEDTATEEEEETTEEEKEVVGKIQESVAERVSVCVEL